MAQIVISVEGATKAIHIMREFDPAFITVVGVALRSKCKYLYRPLRSLLPAKEESIVGYIGSYTLRGKAVTCFLFKHVVDNWFDTASNEILQSLALTVENGSFLWQKSITALKGKVSDARNEV